MCVVCVPIELAVLRYRPLLVTLVVKAAVVAAAGKAAAAESEAKAAEGRSGSSSTTFSVP